MKIGLLAYHSACNFGATLQLLSSYMYWKNRGHHPIVINWEAEDLSQFYNQCVPIAQQELQNHLRQTIWEETRLCHTAQDIAQIIQEENIEAIVIGSDAVCQHHPALERMIFPSKSIITIPRYSSDRMFPNPFWGTFNDFLPKPIPVAYLSVSSQDSNFHLIPHSMKYRMAQRLQQFCYISVRDQWTADMFRDITNGAIYPKVTPDPVFAFCNNAKMLIPTKEDIHRRFGLPHQYIVLSFLYVNEQIKRWCQHFEILAQQEGICCISLPFAHKPSAITMTHNIPLPLNPIDWFAIIRYSQGYVGHNMHPIIVSLHNRVPFYSMDNYGIKKLHNLITCDDSSKIRHLLNIAGFQDYRTSCIGHFYQLPQPNDVLQKLLHFNFNQADKFAEYWYQTYCQNMKNIEHCIGL